MAALPRVCVRRFVRETIQRCVFWLLLCHVGRERRKGKLIASAGSKRHARGRSKGLKVASRFKKNLAAVQEERRGPEKEAERHA